MSPFPRNRPRSQGKARRLKMAGLALLTLSSGGGCGREFFRQWADQDVTEAVFEKSRDPRWTLPIFTVEPPAMSRFAEPFDPDRPPAPPDDPAAEALSPVPQMPHIRLLTPSEGDGYNDLMENGPKYIAPPPEDEQVRRNAEMGIGDEGATPLPPPGPEQAPLAAPPIPEPNTVLPMPGANPAVTPIQIDENNSGTIPNPLTPNLRRETNIPAEPEASTRKPSSATSRQTRLSPKTKRDSGVQQAAFQAPNGPSTVPGDEMVPPDPVPVQVLPDGNPIPPIINDEDLPVQVDINEGPIGRPGITPEEMQAVNRTRASFASVLSPAFVEYNQATTTGLAANSQPYVVNPAQALQLALMNSRAYQYRIENMYIQSLALTLNRFAFQPQFYAGLTPSTGVATGPTGTGGSFPSGGIGANQYIYRTKEFPGGPLSTLTLSEAAGVGKLFSFGGRLLMGFANTMVFNFSGST